MKKPTKKSAPRAAKQEIDFEAEAIVACTKALQTVKSFEGKRRVMCYVTDVHCIDAKKLDTRFTN